MTLRPPLLALLGSLVAGTAAEACSRIVHSSDDGQFVVVGRSMDWFEDIRSNLWVMPRGMMRTANVKQNPHSWTSRYGSVATAAFDVGTTDGLNEKGLVVNMLYLAESDYGPRDPARPGVSYAEYAQYLLDSYATVAELVGSEQTRDLQIIASPLPGSVAKPPTLHFSISDASGDSAIIQFIQGKRTVHHGRQYTVMTNSPPFDQQLAINAYWKDVDGETMLPGTRRAADRYVRASFYEAGLPDPKTTREAVANVLSVVRNVSVPFGMVNPEKPNLSQTIWRTVADSKGLVYFFESTSSPGLVWVKLGDVDLSEGQPVRKLQMAGNPDLSGDQTAGLKPAEMFRFAGEH